jgi:phytoene dehydrogenase-like protein
MTTSNADVIIVGAGLAGLSCALRLSDAGISFVILEADQRIGGRLRTDRVDGFLLDHGFQVLQTAYPEARRLLDYRRLELNAFAPGAIIRTAKKFHRISDPRRRPRDLWRTATAPIGEFKDRLRMIRLALKVSRETVSGIFREPDMTTIEFLRAEGFSEKIIQKFFIPFFAGVCLDPQIRASSRVFQYIFRIFAEGDVALPAQGMGAIPAQLAENLPADVILTEARVESIHPGMVELNCGETIRGQAVVLATEGPETARLLKTPRSRASRGELCLYYAAEAAPLDEPYLILNGDRTGWINSLTIPSVVAPSYAPDGQALITVVVIGHLSSDDETAESAVHEQLIEWFGPVVNNWRHLRTYRILHALPDQSPPMPDPAVPPAAAKSGIYVCGEYGSVPGIQWALLSGRRAAEQILNDLDHR